MILDGYTFTHKTWSFFFFPFRPKKRHFNKVIFIIIIIINPLTARIVGAPHMILQPVFSSFPCSPPPSGTCRTPGLMLSSHLFLCLPCLFPPFTVPCKMVLARPDEQETWPHHRSPRLFTIIRRSSCGQIACWILVRTSSLVIWSLYEISSILR